MPWQTKITEIGNYVIPAFGAVVTSALALGPIAKEHTSGLTVVVDFALYTLLASYVSYTHRLKYLRYRREQQGRGEEPSHLPSAWVCVFLVAHGLLIGILYWRLASRGLV